MADWSSEQVVDWTCHESQLWSIMLLDTARETEMHYYFQDLAADIAHERIREARNWRLATDRRQAVAEARPGLVGRLRAALAGRSQPTSAPTFSPDGCEAA
jgi:hypothetical protein